MKNTDTITITAQGLITQPSALVAANLKTLARNGATRTAISYFEGTFAGFAKPTTFTPPSAPNRSVRVTPTKVKVLSRYSGPWHRAEKYANNGAVSRVTFEIDWQAWDSTTAGTTVERVTLDCYEYSVDKLTSPTEPTP